MVFEETEVWSQMQLLDFSWVNCGEYIVNPVHAKFLLWKHKNVFAFFVSWQHGGTVDSLWLSEAIWRPRSGSALAQVMACCLTAPSHYLNLCWLIINEVQGQSSEGNFTRDDTSVTNYWNELENYLSKFSWNLPGTNELIESLSRGI